MIRLKLKSRDCIITEVFLSNLLAWNLPLTNNKSLCTSSFIDPIICMQPSLSHHAINSNLWSALLIKRLLFSGERNFIRMLRPFARLPKPTSVLFAAFSSGNGKKETLAG